MSDDSDDEFPSSMAPAWSDVGCGLTMHYSPPTAPAYSADGLTWVTPPREWTALPEGVRFIRYGDRITKIVRD